MNIFVTSSCPVASAVALDDRRVVKMILESAQLLSTSVFLRTGKIHEVLYRPTHVKHPCAIWASKSLENWEWLVAHMKALCEEYTFRYGKVHSSCLLRGELNRLKSKDTFRVSGLLPFANCARSESLGVDFRHMKDVHLAYRLFMCAKFLAAPKATRWTKRLAPDWFLDQISEEQKAQKFPS